MKRFIPFFLIIFFAAGVFAEVGTLTVTNVDSTPGTGITVVDYEFSGPAGTYDISAEVSFDNGATYSPIPDKHITTGILTDVIPGTHQLIWDGSDSFPETFSDETIVKITADFTWKCGDDITFTYRDGQVTYGTVSKTYTFAPGKDGLTLCWLDRNLGAMRVATSSTDADAYGDLFQWGRADEGHQLRGNTDHHSGQATTPEPNTVADWDGKFITGSNDWLETPNDNLWQGVDGTNNPCPPGWRVPTEAELEAELLSWGLENDNSEGAFASDLKWPVGGLRSDISGGLELEGSYGLVWSSSVHGDLAKRLTFLSGNAYVTNLSTRAHGMSVRCVRDN